MAVEALSALSAFSECVGKLGQDLFNYGSSLRMRNLGEDVDKLKRQLNLMKPFLSDNANKYYSERLVQEWLFQVEDLVLDTEDVIDTVFVLENQLQSRPKIVKKINKLEYRANEIFKPKQQLSYMIQQGMKDVPSTSSSGDMETLNNARRTTHQLGNTHYSGMKDTIALIKKELISGRSFVVSIVGMGGLGKSMLARTLYNDTELLGTYFKCHAWVCVTQDYKIRDLLLQLTKQCTGKSDKYLNNLTITGTLGECLREQLRKQRYLVVIDDVWDLIVWEGLKRFFPDDNNGSKVIVTARYKKMALWPNGREYVHSLRYLNEDESWELFRETAFSNNNGQPNPGAFEEIGREMVIKCAGLALPIVALGELLLNKSINEWEKVRGRLWEELANHKRDIKDVFTLSFNDLPHEKKQCFLYLGLYPENCKIPILHLIWLWLAEGFIAGDDGNRNAEDVAKGYIDEFKERSLIQVTGEDWNDAMCQVHGLVRYLVVGRAKERRFSRYFGREQTFDLLKKPKTSTRRIAAHGPNSLNPHYDNPFLRTLMGEIEIHALDAIKPLHRRFKMLRVIQVCHTPTQILTLPKEIGQLIHLRYFGLSGGTTVNDLPNTFGKLKALETLSIPESQVFLPNEMTQLVNMRHLNGIWNKCSVLEHFESLQSLEEVESEEWSKIDTSKLKNIQRLAISKISKGKVSTIFYTNLKALERLHDLTLESSSGISEIPIGEILEQCPSIRHLSLWDNRRTKLPKSMEPEWAGDWHEHAKLLQVCEVFVSNPRYDPLHLFKRLARLKALRIEIRNDTQISRQMSCSNGFPSLEKLSILSNRDDISVGTMPPLLRSLTLNGSPVDSWVTF